MRSSVVLFPALWLLLACEARSTPEAAATPSAPATLAASNAPPPAVPAPEGSARGDDALAAGKDLYLKGCANCHGMDGSGSVMRAMLPKIGDLSSAETHARMSDADIAALITDGRDKMPPFKSLWSAEQIASIVTYVRTLKQPAP